MVGEWMLSVCWLAACRWLGTASICTHASCRCADQPTDSDLLVGVVAATTHGCPLCGKTEQCQDLAHVKGLQPCNMLIKNTVSTSHFYSRACHASPAALLVSSPSFLTLRRLGFIGLRLIGTFTDQHHVERYILAQHGLHS